MDYSRIEVFLLLATEEQQSSFYKKFKNDLGALFKDEKAQKTFETKWTLSLKSNVMACFTKIAQLFFAAHPHAPLRAHLAPLYADTLERLLSQEKLSRIEEKFIEPFLIEPLKQGRSMEQYLPVGCMERIYKAGERLSK